MSKQKPATKTKTAELRQPRKRTPTQKMEEAARDLLRAVKAKASASILEMFDPVDCARREAAVDAAVKALTYAALEYATAATGGAA